MKVKDSSFSSPAQEQVPLLPGFGGSLLTVKETTFTDKALDFGTIVWV